MDVGKVLSFGLVFIGMSVAWTFAQNRLDTTSRTSFSLPPLQTTISTGMSYSSALGSSYFVAPSFSKQINAKFRMNFGARYTRFNLKPLVFSVAPDSREVSTVRAWVDGEYKINDKWYLSAYAMKDLGGDAVARNVPFYGPTEAYGVAVDYIPSETVRFRAEFNYSRGNGSYGYYPYGPLNYSMFGSTAQNRFPSLWMMP